MKLSDIPKWLPKLLQELAEGMKAGKRIQFLDKSNNEWRTISENSLNAVLVVTIESPDQYRVEPEPVKPREVWVLQNINHGELGGGKFDTQQEALKFIDRCKIRSTHKPVKFVEVVDE